MLHNRPIVPIIQAIITICIGVGLAIQPIMRFVGHHFGPHYDSTAVLYVSTVIDAHLALVAIGTLLIYVGSYLFTRRKMAFSAALVLLASAGIVLALLPNAPLGALSVIVLLLVWIGISRRYYVVRSDLVSLRLGLAVSFAMVIAGVVYGTFGFLILGSQGFHHMYSLDQALVASLQVVLTIGDFDAPTVQARLFIDTLNVLSVVVLMLVVGTLFRPVRLTFSFNRHDRNRAAEILRNKSYSSDDYFKVWPEDKHYYFSESNRSFLAYAMSRRTVIVLGDPSGVAKEFSALVQSFQAFVMANGWTLAIIGSTGQFPDLYTALNKLFIGNEAIIDVKKYVDQTARSKHFRYVVNRAKRDGLIVEYWQNVSDEKLAQLRAVSDAWVSQGNRKEYTFFMGYFSPVYLKACQVMVLKQGDRVVGYCNVVPSFGSDEASIDHLRSLGNVSPASMHFLLAELITYLKTQNISMLNIGFSPLSGLRETSMYTSISAVSIKKFLELVKRLGNRYYSFQGVEQFKGKFQPNWQPRYLYYSGTSLSLPGVIRDIERASNRTAGSNYRRTLIVGAFLLGIIVVTIQYLW